MALLQLKLKLSAFGISYDGVILSDFCHSVRDHTLRDWGLALFALRGLRHLVNIHMCASKVLFAIYLIFWQSSLVKFWQFYDLITIYDKEARYPIFSSSTLHPVLTSHHCCMSRRFVLKLWKLEPILRYDNIAI